ncbi:MAG: glycine--tRNA ligase [archaeon]
MEINEEIRIKRFNEMLSTRFFFAPTAEIYPNNFSGFYDFGPIGNMFRLNIINFWRNEFVRKNNFYEMSGCIILPKDVFVASGHLENFNDPIATCNKCSQDFRIDKIIFEKIKKELPEGLEASEYEKIIKDNKIKCSCGGEFINFRKFNMMAPLNIGATSGNIGYLRGETCQSIFVNFKRIYNASRDCLPIGISQYGTVYRNEISPRNGLLRTREFEQIETELFFDADKINEVEIPKDKLNYKIRFKLLKDNLEKDYSLEEIDKQKITCGKLFTYYLYVVQDFMEKLGIKHENLRFREVPSEDRAFYSKQTFDFEIKIAGSFEGGWLECFSFNYRTDHDLKGHSKISKKDLSINEEGKIIWPHVLELESMGVGRIFYTLLDNNFKVIEEKEGLRNILSLPPRLSPYFVAILPLMKKDGLYEKAEELTRQLKDKTNNLFEIAFDEKGSIGKRYARLDEIGTNYCLTIDYDTLKDNSVTIRDRDSFSQKRVKIEELDKLLLDLYFEKKRFEEI